MTDQALNYYLAYGTNAARLAFTPSPPSPPAGPSPSYIWYETDTGSTYIYDTSWHVLVGSGTVTSVASGAGLTGGPITATGTLDIIIPPNPGGRLTLTSATPVLTANVTAATTIYYALYNGNYIPIWDGAKFVPTAFTELSQATTDTTKSPAAVAASKNYDMFVWNDASTIRCTRGPAWSSDTSRGTGAGTTELERKNGIWTNKVAITNGPGANLGTYVGTVRSNGSSQIDTYVGSTGADGGVSGCVVGVWNMYNRVLTIVENQDTTNSWNYTLLTWRKKNNTSNNRISFVCGLAEDALEFTCEANHQNTSAVQAGIAAALDSETSATTGGSVHFTACGANQACEHNAKFTTYQLGFHYFIQLEISVATGTTTWVGDNGAGENWAPSRLAIWA